jgi:predicted SprT family Zn-dependent metalloprotease
MNREQWLTAAVKALRSRVVPNSFNLPERIKISCGWPGSGSIKTRIGVCWPAECSTAGNVEIFISPILADPVRILDVLTHELGHATGIHEHGKDFKAYMKAVGLEGKATSSHAGEDLLERLNTIAEKLGPYPHDTINPSDPLKKQSTRMLLISCECGLKVRTVRKWVDAVQQAGKPFTCWLCGKAMTVPEGEPQEDSE